MVAEEYAEVEEAKQLVAELCANLYTQGHVSGEGAAGEGAKERGPHRGRAAAERAGCCQRNWHITPASWAPLSPSFVSGTGGGISIKVPTPGGDRIVMAPSGVQKERMRAEDMFVLDTAGRVGWVGWDGGVEWVWVGLGVGGGEGCGGVWVWGRGSGCSGRVQQEGLPVLQLTQC